VKNNYPLPLITELIDNMGSKKVFTKMDLRWGFNNVRIKEGKVAAFVDDVLVGTEIEEGYDEIVEEILRRLEENDLYIKPEKCVWKVRKIEFLGVVIEPDGIEMEAEKVDGVFSWPWPKNVRDVRKFLGLVNYYRRFIKDFA